ncbi:GNAT family N-acetyltransferase [Gaiella sp.]|uniref:GNAT family N-acetyltransferase n=1 Tax=Gaiella sp. TaxID=2663207 RepID=UPI0032639099
MKREGRVSLAAYRCLYPEAVILGGVTVLRADAAPTSPMLNQIVGLGVDAPATEDALDAALATIGDDVSCYVAVAAEARPPELVDWLLARSLEPGWGWMSFRRGLEEIPERPTQLTLVRVGPVEAEAFGRIVATGYGLPDAAAAWASRAHELGWDCWLAADGDEPAAAAGLYASEGVGYLGFAATLPEHRGKGGQSALLAERIRHARAIGCDVVVTETGERRDDRPSNSYRNILRAGFTEVTVRANWLRPAQIT